MTVEARIIDACDAAVAQIAAAHEAGTFAPLRFTALRSYAAWDSPLDVCDRLQVDAVPSRYDVAELLARNRIGYQTSIELYVREKFGPNIMAADNQIPDEIIDARVRLVEQLYELFATQKRTPGDTTISWKSGAILTACSRPHLHQHRAYFGALKLTFDAPRIITPIAT